MSTKRKNSKCLDVCVTDLPVFKEILRLPSKPVSPGGHKAGESKVDEKSVRHPETTTTPGTCRGGAEPRLGALQVKWEGPE